MAELSLPNNWTPRPYQLRAWGAFERCFLDRGPVRRFSLNWHRRAGKDDVALHGTALAAHTRVAPYWHMLPLQNQARKAIWNAVDPHTGKRRIDMAFPIELRRRTLDQEMFIEFHNGSTWQVLGSDSYNAHVGASPAGIVFSEYALANPNSWGYLRPILRENDGWAAFITTSRGHNHYERLHRAALSDENWFAQTLTVTDTGVLTPEDIAAERREIYAERGAEEGEALIQQEYYCSFDAAIPGAYYGSTIAKMEQLKYIGPQYRWNSGFPVYTSWDLGIADDSAIWFFQIINSQPIVIDYYETSGVGIEHYAQWMSKRPYNYARPACAMPHDAGHRQLAANGKSLAQIIGNLGFPCEVVPRTGNLSADIIVTRMFLMQCRFATESQPAMGIGGAPDETELDARERMARGLDALRQYHRERDDERRAFRDHPEHDWCSHAADAFRTFACSKIAKTLVPVERHAAHAQMAYDPFKHAPAIQRFASSNNDNPFG